jgi:chaperone modulatory protein CbpM
MANPNALRGELIEAETLISLAELCRNCIVQTEEVITMVREGILEPAGGDAVRSGAERWQFHVSSVRRVRTVVRLQRDLGVNLPGAALALELLDRIAELERSL